VVGGGSSYWSWDLGHGTWVMGLDTHFLFGIIRAGQTKEMTVDHKNYPKSLKDKSVESLRFIIQDAGAAIAANPDNPKNSYYQDEICYAGMELRRRGL